VKKILFVSHGSELYGAMRSLMDAIILLDREHYESIVIAPKKGPLIRELEKHGIVSYLLRMPSWHFPSRSMGGYSHSRTEFLVAVVKTVLKLLLFEVPATIRIIRIIQKAGIDLVYTNSSAVHSGALAAFFTKKPHVWHIRENMDSKDGGYRFILPKRLSFAIMCKLSAAIVANSKSTAAQFDQISSCSNVIVIYNGIYTREYAEVHQDNDSLTESRGKWQVAVIGSLCEMKSQEDAIKAVGIASQNIGEIELLLIGDGRTAYKEHLKNLAGDLCLSEKVVFTGFIDDVLRILPNMKVVLVPSISESFGRVAIEAMAAGVPVIAADVGGLSEIITDGFNGILVPRRSPEAIANKLIFIYTNPQKSQELIKNAQDWVYSNCDVVQYSRRIEEVISSLL